MIELNVEKGAGCAVAFHVRVKPEACEAAYQKAMRELRKKVSIPGFRKGKVPESVIAQNFGERLQHRCIDILIQDVFTQSAAQSGIMPWNNETIEAPKLEEFSRDGELDLTYRFERTPEIPEVGTVDLPEIPEEEITEEALEEHLAQVRRHYATYEEKEVVEDGDRVTWGDQQVEVDKKNVPDWFYEGVIGQKAGVLIKDVKIEKVERPILPNDEEFVAAAQVESMDQLRERGREHLRKDAEQRRHQARVEALWQYLFKTYPFELPATLIEEEKRSRVKRMVQQARSQNLSDEEMLAKEKEIEGAAAAEAERAIRVLFLSRAIVDRAGLEPSHQDVVARTHSMLTWQALMAGKTPPPLDEAAMRPYFDQVHLQLIKEIAEDHLLATPSN